MNPAAYIADVLLRVQTQPAARIDELLPQKLEAPGAVLKTTRSHRMNGNVRDQVRDLRKLGPLPAEREASVEQLKAYEVLLHAITKPLTDEEARSLACLFGPDECFGLAWTLLHLVEAAPGWPLRDCLVSDGEWTRRLRDRARRGGKLV